MQKYKQLDLQDRHKIKALLDAGHNRTKIAEIIGVHKSNISRELSRNVTVRGRYANKYRPQAVQRKTNKRHCDKRKHIRFTEDLKLQAGQWLCEEKLSPELISARWSLQGIDGVSGEAIYQWIWQEDCRHYRFLKETNSLYHRWLCKFIWHFTQKIAGNGCII